MRAVFRALLSALCRSPATLRAFTPPPRCASFFKTKAVRDYKPSLAHSTAISSTATSISYLYCRSTATSTLAMAQTPPMGGGGSMGGPFPPPSIGVAPLSSYNQQGLLNSAHGANSGHHRNSSTTSSSESLNRGRFEGKVVVVTGGGQGIGSVTVKAFAREGARVVIADIDPEAGGELAESLIQIPSYGDRVMFVQTDVSDENR
eukprot:TRINITY_DN13959_c0_g2_i1.p1 TRINITY_DN13959_c0_g2~~TRINITY_DN13959_c0_g2_i1.p1  ORF type:complete len:204 (+),score=18.16 TRINITY_DN13959_c0_g2_i1:90-701(+)